MLSRCWPQVRLLEHFNHLFQKVSVVFSNPKHSKPHLIFWWSSLLKNIQWERVKVYENTRFLSLSYRSLYLRSIFIRVLFISFKEYKSFFWESLKSINQGLDSCSKIWKIWYDDFWEIPLDWGDGRMSSEFLWLGTSTLAWPWSSQMQLLSTFLLWLLNWL